MKKESIREKIEVESEDDVTQHEVETKRRPVKRIRSNAYVEESDDNMITSGVETSHHPPPPSRSPSPRPRREAAKRAEIAMAAAVRVVNYEERRAKHRMYLEEINGMWDLILA